MQKCILGLMLIFAYILSEQKHLNVSHAKIAQSELHVGRPILAKALQYCCCMRNSVSVTEP